MKKKSLLFINLLVILFYIISALVLFASNNDIIEKCQLSGASINVNYSSDNSYHISCKNDGINNFSNEKLLIFITILINEILFAHPFVIIALIATNIAIMHFFKDIKTGDDIKKYKNYYRDIIKDYSPLVLSYIDNFKVNYKTDIIAILLKMKANGKIKIENNKIIFTEDDNLNSIEKFLKNNTIDGIININENSLDTIAYDYAIKNNLIEKFDRNVIVNKKQKKLIIIYVIILILNFLMIFNVDFINSIFASVPNFMDIILVVFMFLLFLSAFVFPIFIFVYIMVYSFKSNLYSFVRTKKGEEINTKLEGLKNYLKDFSNLDEKCPEDVIIWDDYLIYSVLFEQNIKIIDEWNKYVKINI